MKCVIPSAKAFYKLLNFIAQFETNVKITCQKAGMSVFCMSACHSVFIDLKIDPSYYTKYECEKDEEIGINLAVFLAALKNGGQKDELALSTSQDHVDMDIISESEVTKYTIKMMNIDNENMEIPHIEEDVTLDIAPSYLKKWKSKVVDFTKASVQMTPTKLEFQLESSDDVTNGKVKVVQHMPATNIEYVRFQEPKPITVGNKMISKAFNVGDVSDEVQIGWKNEMPIRFGAKITDYSFLNLYIAPMITDQMDED